jgi:DNA-binding XRE family transcriptional regulator
LLSDNERVFTVGALEKGAVPSTIKLCILLGRFTGKDPAEIWVDEKHISSDVNAMIATIS